MTGFKSKREMAEDKLLPQKDFGDALTIAYQSGYYDGKKAAQPAQEPVAWCSQCGHKCPLPAQEPVATLFGTLPVYDNTPPQRPWVGLEGEEIRYLWEEATKPDRSTMTMVTSFAQAIEAKLKEKNT